MPTYATGIAKKVFITEEVTEGTNPVTGGSTLRRVSSDLALNKDSYESQEILASQQIRDARHGVRRPQGTFAGQISPNSFNDFWQGILRNDFVAGVTINHAMTLDESAGTFTVTLGAEEDGFVTLGFKKGDVVRMSGAGTGYTALNGRNMRVKAVTDTVLTVEHADIVTTPALSDGSVTGTPVITVAGQKVWMPSTGHQYKSYSIEHWFSDISQSELFLGCRFGPPAIALPATGLVTFNSQIIGINMVQNSTQQITPVADATSTNALAAVNGVLSFGGTDQAVVTGMNIQLNGALGADPVVGSNIVPHIFQGRFRVGGNMTVLFMDETIPNYFVNETEVAVHMMLTVGSGVGAEFMRFSMPRVKLMGSTRSDSDMSLISSFNFVALENVDDTDSDLSTFVIQDSLVS